MKTNKQTKKKNKWLILIFKMCLSVLIILGSNFYLQLSQNEWSWSLAAKFAFSWHTEKFLLGSLVLFVFWLFWLGLSGSWSFSLGFYLVVIGLLGYANNQKMFYRLEPLYPDDLKMIAELGLMKEMIGLGPFFICLLFIGIALGGLVYVIYRSFKRSKKYQAWRLGILLFASVSLLYVNGFNKPGNILRAEYDKTALWIPYSQKMNYYNTGFMGGFLYNLKVAPMTKPENYSAEKVAEIVKEYQIEKETLSEKPNIVYIMSESFSDPLGLKNIKVEKDPLAVYRQLAKETFSGQMLSQNYGGGTANIEFEALTSLSMEPFNPQMTTPYTMLVPKLLNLPSMVSMLKARNYTTTALHPYNTSMYKRQDVYEVLGFDEFIYEDTMKHTGKIENNPFISDKEAYEEVLDILDKEGPQFVHLVTMQTHLPYDKKYPNADYGLSGSDNPSVLNNYMADIDYSSQALAEFIKAVESLGQRTLVVFWGDHLPSIYSEAFQKQNTEVDLHLTEFMFYDTAKRLETDLRKDTILSPVFFGPTLFKQAELEQPGFYQLLNQLVDVLPAFEKNQYYVAGKWQKELKLPRKAEKIYKDYQLIQYDLVAGKQYSLKTGFFGD